MSFEIQIVERPHATIFRCDGRFVVGDGVARLRDSVLAALSGARPCILSLDGVTQIDAWGLGMLAEFHKAALQRSASFLLAAAQPQVREMLHLAGLGHQLEVYDSVQQAEASRPRVA